MRSRFQQNANANFFKKEPVDNDCIVVAAAQKPQPKQDAPAGGEMNPKALQNALMRAKQTGTLSLQSRGLKVFPKELLNFQDLAMENVNWWDGFDLGKVDLSNNEIEVIPDEVGTQEFLAHLNFNSNKLTAIPDTLWTLENLKFLDISNNKITHLSEGIGKAAALVELRVSGNLLITLPQTFGELMNLEVLDLKTNKLNQLPNSFGMMGEKLLKLYLDENQLQVLPASVGNLQRLTDLSIGKNKLKQVENDCLVFLENLVMLDLHQNQFRAFSAVPKSRKLDTLAMSFNSLEGIDNLENAPNLTVVDLHNNKLTALPESLLQLQELKTLKISNNNLSDINPRIALLPNLVRMNIEGNTLKSIKPAMRSAGAVQLKKYLAMRLEDSEVQQIEKKQDAIKGMPNSTGEYDHWSTLLREFVQGSTLDLKNKQVEGISQKLWASEHLTVLDLSQNPKIGAISDDIKHLVNLKTLRLIGCQLTEVPAGILSLKYLSSIELDKNNLKSFFPQYKGFETFNLGESLSYLSLNGNQLKTVPKICKAFPKLRQLHMHMNQLTDVRELCRPMYSELEIVDFGNNKIRELPIAFVVYLTGLTHLTLTNNDIGQLPSLLGNHKKLNALQVDGNPLKQIRRQIIDKGTIAVMQYLRDKFIQGRDDVVEEWALQQAKERGNDQPEYFAQNVQEERKSYEPQQQQYMQGLSQNQQQQMMEMQRQQQQQQEQLYQQMMQQQQMAAQKKREEEEQALILQAQNQMQLQQQQQVQAQAQAQSMAAQQQMQQQQQPPVVDNSAKRKELEQQIKALQNDLDNNFSLSRMQIMERKRQMNQLISQKNSL